MPSPLLVVCADANKVQTFDGGAGAEKEGEGELSLNVDRRIEGRLRRGGWGERKGRSKSGKN